MNFDRVADIYDETRGLPQEIVDAVTKRIVTAAHATPETRFLELGIGTGRIALPLIEAGYPYTGVDISEQMVERLREKAGAAPNLSVQQASISDLPFADDSFDVVVAVHVFHLVAEWERAIQEVQRVLTPDGYFILGDDRSSYGSISGELRRRWRELVQELGGELRPRYGTSDRVLAILTERGWRSATYLVAAWERTYRPISVIEQFNQRTFSDSWMVSDEVLAETNTRLVEWARERYSDLGEESTSEEEFVLAVSRSPEEPE